MESFAVIDTETNWSDAVMSIGAVIAEVGTFRPLSAKYYIITPEYKAGGMYSHALFLDNKKLNLEYSREAALNDLIDWLEINRVADLFAYNASFDCRHLPELSSFTWYDIMRMVAYRQYNPKISPGADCHGTGRLKCGYGVESMLRLLSGDAAYSEQHNALTDALDELKIMELLQRTPSRYLKLYK